MRITRRRFLSVLGTLGAAAGGGWLYASRYEPTFLEATHRLVEGLELPRTLRVLHVSDLHVFDEASFVFARDSLRYGLNEAPDLVFLTGDFITGLVYQPGDYAALLRSVSSVVPVYACLGNHDGGSWVRGRLGRDPGRDVEKLLAQGGVQLLRNERVSLEYSHGIEVAGLGDLWAGECAPERCLGRLDARKNKGIPLILLSHNPDSKAKVAEYAWDLMLSGHTHGGQFRVPLTRWRPFLPVEDSRIAAGLYRWQGRHIHVTRGVGNLHGLRFLCRPEISMLELK